MLILKDITLHCNIVGYPQYTAALCFVIREKEVPCLQMMTICT